MATYIVLGQFTDQGIRNVAGYKQACRRRQSAGKEGRRQGARSFLDDRPIRCCSNSRSADDETMTVFGLSAGKLGNVCTETLRAFSQAEIGQILKRVV